MSNIQQLEIQSPQNAMPAPVAPAENPSAAILSVISRAAENPNVDMEKFERLMLMKERMEAAEARRAFDEAVAAAKGEIGPIIKNRVVDFKSTKGHTHYQYEDFAGIAAVVDPVLAKYALSYRFRSKQEGAKLTITCILSKGGYAEETSLSSGEDHSGNKNDIQSIGSAATFLQRYTLKLALGLASAHDDDGRATSAKTADARSSEAESEFLTPEQVERVRKALEFADTDEAKFLAFIKTDSIEAIYRDKFQKVMSLIQQKADQKRKGN